MVEGAGVLGYCVEGAAEGAEGASVDGVGMGYCVYFGAGGVYGVVDHVGYWRGRVSFVLREAGVGKVGDIVYQRY